ncbi:MAG: response regulator [Spirochaetia bacterium]|jgi:DNA-binding response OmpR family regulator|nr:response regulator [Spirochaetia bacterium]
MKTQKIILAIDDMLTDLSSLQVMLEKNFDVRICKSAGTALKILETLKADLILLDIEMPGMSGFEFLHTIRKRPEHWNTPVIIVSGHTEEEFFSHALKQGADACIPKPVQAGELLRKIQEILDKPSRHAPV